MKYNKINADVRILVVVGTSRRQEGLALLSLERAAQLLPSISPHFLLREILTNGKAEYEWAGSSDIILWGANGDVMLESGIATAF